MEVGCGFINGFMRVHWRFIGSSSKIHGRFIGGLSEVNWRFFGDLMRVFWLIRGLFGGWLGVYWWFHLTVSKEGSLKVHQRFMGDLFEVRQRFIGGSLVI